MQRPFLIVRFVSFSLLFNLNLLILVFASWHINATLAVGAPAPGTAILSIFNSCLMFICVTCGFMDRVIPDARVSRILFECVWSAVLSLLQAGAAISITVNGPMMTCYDSSFWSICASSSLLVPTIWLSSIIVLAHFMALFASTMAHTHMFPDIWSRTVHSIPWFLEAPADNSKVWKVSAPDVDSWARHLDDIEATAGFKRRQYADEVEKAPWAATANIRRGVDIPFTNRCDSPPAAKSEVLPPLPLRVQPKSITRELSFGSRFIEKFRESQLDSRSVTRGPTLPSTPFPPRVDDHDLPIPLPRLSEWIRADALRGISVHTVPHAPDSSS
ncbi:hypothetical protein BD779DRAFT_1669046 [Infundibulicybe gibba]|nr:hypothetical protein BD779DRAFT_1669046 [Infundibulicybe gibba]